MRWYHYLSYFFGGAFLANAVPHFVNGVSGNSFQSPFAHPPGQGLSPALTNALWGFGNLVVGYLLVAKVGTFDVRRWRHALVAGAGALLMSVMLARAFAPFHGGLATSERNTSMPVHYVEIVTNDADTVAALYERTQGLTFGTPDADLGQARVSTRADGALVGIRKPLAASEQPIIRTYFAVDDIEKAAKSAEANGATIAYPPTRQGQRGMFAILVQGGVEHGLWQR